MSNWINLFLSNKILIAGIVAWIVSQVLKTIIFLIVNKELSLDRLIGDGGMPSSHSATVTSIAAMSGISCGFDSPIFAIAFIMAAIVMHDARGVRLETGKQAKVINDLTELVKSLSGEELTPEDKLKELVGHTPLQVFSGFVIGVLTAILMA